MLDPPLRGELRLGRHNGIGGIPQTHTEVPVKLCKACGLEKPLDQFYAFTKKRDGNRWVNHSTRCKPCHNAQVIACRVSRETDDPEQKALRLLSDIRSRCTQRSITFDLDEAWILERWRAGCCEATGIPFDEANGKIHHRPWGFSIDRNDQTKGYTKDNCKAVVWAYNRAKGTGTDADVVRLAKALLQKEAA